MGQKSRGRSRPREEHYQVPGEVRERWYFELLEAGARRRVRETADRKTADKARTAARQYRRRTGRRVAIAHQQDGSLWAWRMS